MSDIRTTERRAARRSRQLKNGTIVLSGSNSVLSCTVRNMSADGLCLIVPNALLVPAAFEVLVDGQRRRCTVMWRQPNRIGVKYR